MTVLPGGTVTLLMTDIERSTSLWQDHPRQMADVIERHNELLSECVARQAGIVIKERGEGDSVFSVFTSAGAGVIAACEVQRLLRAETWPTGCSPRVRIALHTGEPIERDGDYLGPVVNRCARLRALAHGGQTLLSSTTHALAAGCLPDGIRLEHLGRYRLRGIADAEEIYQAVCEGGETSFPPLRGAEGVPNNLPLTLTSFVGRATEVGRLTALLGQARLVVITGPPGSGKTRLARHVASELLASVPGGVWYTSLSAAETPHDVLASIASVLGVCEGEAETLERAVADALCGTHLLLLDHCERVTAACAALVRTLLARAPDLRILVSSLTPLSVPGERRLVLGPLTVPPDKAGGDAGETAKYDAVRLFVDRASARNPAFELTDRNAATLAMICRRLDGLPLALELAAARLGVLSLDDLATRLRDPFGTLTGGVRTDPGRPRTLHAEVAWSYELLDRRQQRLFRRLAIFAGIFDLPAVGALWRDELTTESEVIDALGDLVDRSMVAVVEDVSGGSRFHLLDTLRLYALEELRGSGETDECRRRHAEHFLDVALDAQTRSTGASTAEAQRRFAEVHDDLRSAIAWCADRAASDGIALEIGLRMCTALWRYWCRAGHLAEGSALAERILAAADAADADPAVHALALRSAGNMAYFLGDLDVARQRYELCLAMERRLGREVQVAQALDNLGSVARNQGRHDDALRLGSEALTVLRRVGTSADIVVALANVASLAMAAGDCPSAMPHLVEGLERSRAIGDRSAEAHFAMGLGTVAASRCDLVEARRRYEESLRIRREIPDRDGSVAILSALGFLDRLGGAFDAAERRLAEARALAAEIGDRFGLATTMEEVGQLARARGDRDSARLAFTEALEINQGMGRRAAQARLEARLGALALADPDPAPARARADAAHRVAQAVGDRWLEAYTLGLLGTADMQQGDLSSAAAHVERSLQILLAVGDRRHQLDALGHAACVLAEARRGESALRISAAAHRIRTQVGIDLPVPERFVCKAYLDRVRDALDDARRAFVERAGAALSLEQAVAEALRELAQVAGVDAVDTGDEPPFEMPIAP